MRVDTELDSNYGASKCGVKFLSGGYGFGLCDAFSSDAGKARIIMMDGWIIINVFHSKIAVDF